ncbi:NCS2 family permease [Deinococcus yavapaiensis]|uniref:AGZA family xanthine/uracil permease-like MFS transporter n=1 Tax=Deinococcus yavapaiensis KR-236 TaxID=694435 RepID=A0A318S3G9_9DEIO|nr:NCS2 family permease [Deinococcus yavapaiensis]PYE52932.1 AGZA family xanthine/uracil permease-like MFS transporter [Deinococcus yavapaiensis KR-236]
MQNTQSSPIGGWLEQYFGIRSSGSTIPREVRAGVTTFLTMSYILFVNPSTLGPAINVPNAFVQLLVTTAIAAAFGSLMMGLVARYPFAQAPGMGLNAYFAFSVVLGQKIPWQTALGAVFISGLLFVILSALGARQAVVKAIPSALKFAVTAGIGAFLAFIGLKNAGIIVANPATFVALGDLRSAPALVAILGLIVTAVLLSRGVVGAILIGIAASSVLAIITRAPVYAGGANGALQPFQGFGNGIVAAPIWPHDLVGALDIGGALGLGLLSVVFTFFFVDFFDATGTLTGLANKAGFMTPEGDMPRARRTFISDGLAAMFGAFMGTSTTTAYIESASGIEEGGRTGLTAVVVGLLFLLAIFLWPLAGAVPAAATAPALVLVGAMMLSSLARIEWDDYATTIPVFLTVISMPLTFSIANGVSFGVLSYVAIKALNGQAKQVHPLLYFVAALLLVRFIWLEG